MEQVAKRGGAIIEKRKASSAASAASAVCDHIHDWLIGTEDGYFSKIIKYFRINGSCYRWKIIWNQTINLLVSVSRDKEIKVWNTILGVNLFTLSGHDNWVNGVSFHPDGIHMFSVSDDKTIRVLYTFYNRFGI